MHHQKRNQDQLICKRHSRSTLSTGTELHQCCNQKSLVSNSCPFYVWNSAKERVANFSSVGFAHRTMKPSTAESCLASLQVFCEREANVYCIHTLTCSMYHAYHAALPQRSSPPILVSLPAWRTTAPCFAVSELSNKIIVLPAFANATHSSVSILHLNIPRPPPPVGGATLLLRSPYELL